MPCTHTHTHRAPLPANTRRGGGADEAEAAPLKACEHCATPFNPQAHGAQLCSDCAEDQCWKVQRHACPPLHAAAAAAPRLCCRCTPPLPHPAAAAAAPHRRCAPPPLCASVR
eukprot:2936913-Prymnesium_polylepis.1